MSDLTLLVVAVVAAAALIGTAGVLSDREAAQLRVECEARGGVLIKARDMAPTCVKPG